MVSQPDEGRRSDRQQEADLDALLRQLRHLIVGQDTPPHLLDLARQLEDALARRQGTGAADD